MTLLALNSAPGILYKGLSKGQCLPRYTHNTSDLINENYREIRVIENAVLQHVGIDQWCPTRSTRATSGTHMLFKWHTKSLYINADSQEFTIFWKYLPPSLFPALPDMALRYRCRFGSTYIWVCPGESVQHELGKK